MTTSSSNEASQYVRQYQLHSSARELPGLLYRVYTDPRPKNRLCVGLPRDTAIASSDMAARIDELTPTPGDDQSTHSNASLSHAYR